MLTYLCFTLLVSASTFSQAYEGNIEYEKKRQQAFVVDFPYSSDAVQNALTQRMLNLGYKGKEEKGIFNKDKGFIVYRNAYITDISSSSFDYIFYVDNKGKKDRQEALLYMVVQKNGQNAMDQFDAADMRQSKAFLNDLLPDVEAADLEIQISDQEAVITKADKKLRNLQSDKEDKENKIKKLQQEVVENQKAQEDTQKDIDNQRQILGNLKLKRKPGKSN